jgi:hypothetical protein|tara:strand:+ start:953 stop:1189 length:237 start_codon:yes stop_codon:yes gene_type:complete
MTEEVSYIKEYCQLPPLEAPLYDEDADTWSLWFEEKQCSWFPYPEEGLLAIPFKDKYEAQKAYLYLTDEEDTTTAKNS